VQKSLYWFIPIKLQSILFGSRNDGRQVSFSICLDRDLFEKSTFNNLQLFNIREKIVDNMCNNIHAFTHEISLSMDYTGCVCSNSCENGKDIEALRKK
jgi:hypothetical protein